MQSVRPFRFTVPLQLVVGAGAVLTVWFGGVLLDLWTAPWFGWALLPVMTCCGAITCWQAGVAPGMHPAGGRLWKLIAVSCAMLTVGVVIQVHDALFTGPTPSQRMSYATLGCYMGAVLVAQYGLLRLPGRVAMTGGKLRYALDIAVVLIATAALGWHYSFRYQDKWSAVSGSVLPLLATVVVAFVTLMTFVKVASLGTGAVDQPAMRLMVFAVGASSAAGSLSPLLLGHPVLADAHLSVSTASLIIAFAGDRQRRAAAVPPSPKAARRRRWSIVPYAAVAVANLLLLIDGAGADRKVLTVAAVTLTGLVIVRQIGALSENSRLLGHIDRTVRELSEARDPLATQATHDELTGLANRRMLHERIDASVSSDAQLLLIDLDDFKAVNDRLGHHVGDALLRGVADRLRSATGPCGPTVAAIYGSGPSGPPATVARLGGDEFAILLAPATVAEADATAERVVEALSRPIEADGQGLLVGASVGVASLGTRPRDAAGPLDTAGSLDTAELIRRADVAMYAAKSAGKQRSARFRPEMDEDSAADARLGADLRQALDARELTLHYQPFVTLPDGRITGAEALVRWGKLPPSVFIPVAERTGTILPLGEWILREACTQAAAWRRTPGGEQLQRISVNVSARQLREPNFASRVAAIVRETGIPDGMLIVEVTETAVFDGGAALASVRALHHAGIAIALDDFGTGHSSLGLLRTCPVDILKVDKSFVDEIASPRGQEAVIATALIRITEGLGLLAVAEGVETASQAERLHELGYQLAQGYYFARPMPAPELSALLAAQLVAAQQ